MNGSEQLDTYYVYDSYGRLCYVLQPMYQSEADLSKYAYRYEYDSRGRCIKKTLPGTEYVLYEYDENDRLIYSQDGRQRAAGKWLRYFYDALGRITYRMEINSKSLILMEGDIRNHYDNYSFLSDKDLFSNTYLWSSEYNLSAPINSEIGRLTGTEVKVIGSNIVIRTAYYYNTKGELTNQITNNLLGGFDTYEYTYTFTGQPATITHTHTANGKPAITEVLTYTYDHGERLTKVTHKLNNAAAVTIAEYTYDKFGRIAAKKLNGGNNTTYNYNIRDWLTNISNNKFTQSLTYNILTTSTSCLPLLGSC